MSDVVGPFTRLALRNVRCFRDATIELDPRLTVLIGENGAGKTTAVEALASLASGDGEGLEGFPLARGARGGEIALFDGAGARPAAVWKTGRSGRRRLPEMRHLFAYGRYRRVCFPPDEDNDEAPARRLAPLAPAIELDALAKRARERRTTTLFRPDNHLLRDLSRYLVALHFAGRADHRLGAVWQRLNESLRELGHGLERIEIEEDRKGEVAHVVRQGVPLELRDLSDGYQALLVIVFDLILRYLYLFPALEDPLLGVATVAIDEVDLHLHPHWQRTVAAQLTTLFPKTQLVLTTHSPAVVQGAIDRGWRVVALQEGKSGVTARALTARERADLEGAEIGSVLRERKLFAVGSRYSPEYSEVEERVARLQRRIERGTASDGERRQLFADLETLQKLVAADEERRADGSFLSRTAALRVAFLRDLAAEFAKARG